MNLQNIPYIYNIKEVIRFTEPNPLTGQKRLIGDADLSQIELRIAAELSKDPRLLWAYDNGVDLHTYRAIRILGFDADKLTGDFSVENWHWVVNHGEWSKLSEKEQKIARKKAKAGNFGFLFGMWWTKFIEYAAASYDVDFTDEEAKAMRELFYEDHAGLPKWYTRVEEFAGSRGYVESLSGRRRRLPAMKLNPQSSEEAKQMYSDAKRQAINSPVQGFGSGDLKAMAIIGIRKEMIARGWWKTKMMIFGEVHDSVVFWTDEDIAHEVCEIMLGILRHPPLLDDLGITLRVPIDAEAALGDSYGTTVPV